MSLSLGRELSAEFVSFARLCFRLVPFPFPRLNDKVWPRGHGGEAFQFEDGFFKRWLSVRIRVSIAGHEYVQC